MAHDRLWRLVPNTHDNTFQLEVLTFATTSRNAPLANLSFEHGFFTFSNYAQKHCIKSCCALAS
jgi:hypothetical protein